MKLSSVRDRFAELIAGVDVVNRERECPPTLWRHVSTSTSGAGTDTNGGARRQIPGGRRMRFEVAQRKLERERDLCVPRVASPRAGGRKPPEKAIRESVVRTGAWCVGVAW
jgi:hypothetical protein